MAITTMMAANPFLLSSDAADSSDVLFRIISFRFRTTTHHINIHINMRSFQQCCLLLVLLCCATNGLILSAPRQNQRRTLFGIGARFGDDDDHHDAEGTIDSSSIQDSPSTIRPPPLLDPYSEESIDILRNDIHLSSSQITKVQRLADLVCDWNTRINLVSRKDCSPSVVFSRHILPCLCCTTLMPNSVVMDVGTGGGFPGLVLAIQYPSCSFILLDAIGKKLVAVSDMVQQLELDNVIEVHHGRVEAYESSTVDVVTGRGVSDLRAFMGATQHVMRSEQSQLVYWAGGDSGVDERQWCEACVPLSQAIPSVVDVDDDKRVLTFTKASVSHLAIGKGKVIPQQTQPHKKSERRTRQSKLAKGAWSRRDSTQKKQRGYDNFKRYDSSSRTSAPSDSSE